MEATKRHKAGPARKQVPASEGVVPSHSPFPLSAEQVFYDYAPRVYSTARRMVRNDIDAEDVTQEVLLQVVRKLPTFRGDATFPTWLHRVTVNAALLHRRRQAVRQEKRMGPWLTQVGNGEPALESSPGRFPEPEAQMLEDETQQLIEKAIAALPELYRTVFVLADVEGWPNADIAAQLHLSLPAVKSRLHRARSLLRDALAPHFNEGRPSAGTRDGKDPGDRKDG
jgi:RNA polymerase sigma-70 factor (ECF subfamily)